MGQKLVKQHMTNWWWKSLKCSLLFGGLGPNLTTTWNRSLAELPNVESFVQKQKRESHWKSTSVSQCHKARTVTFRTKSTTFLWNKNKITNLLTFPNNSVQQPTSSISIPSKNPQALDCFGRDFSWPKTHESPTNCAAWNQGRRTGTGSGSWRSIPFYSVQGRCEREDP